MPTGKVVCICICPNAGEEMVEIGKVTAEAGKGLVGDRYHNGGGSWNRGRPGKRQVTFMNADFVILEGYLFMDTRRNIFTRGIELMGLINKEFTVGDVTFRGVKYCDPCNRPSDLASKRKSFRDTFFDRGGLIAEIVTSGVITEGDIVKVSVKK